jgi:hypothetical protein
MIHHIVMRKDIAMLKRNLFVFVTFVIIALISPTAQAQTSNPLEPTAQQTENQTRYVPGQIIVKFKHSLTKCPHCFLSRRQSFQGATTDQSDSLDQLNQRYGVHMISPFFGVRRMSRILKLSGE